MERRSSGYPNIDQDGLENLNQGKLAWLICVLSAFKFYYTILHYGFCTLYN